MCEHNRHGGQAQELLGAMLPESQGQERNGREVKHSLQVKLPETPLILAGAFGGPRKPQQVYTRKLEAPGTL